jgi:hypothetical protein
MSAFGETEKAIAEKLNSSIKGAKRYEKHAFMDSFFPSSSLLCSFACLSSISVKDTSGGCGSFYQIEITADEFRWEADTAPVP